MTNEYQKTPGETYEILLRKLHDLDNKSEEADLIRDQMEDPWYSMSEEEQVRMSQLSEDLYIEKEGICYISWSGQPDLQFLCDNAWSTPCWGKPYRSGIPGKEVYLADNKRYYTFNKELTTCPKCKEKLK